MKIQILSEHLLSCLILLPICRLSGISFQELIFLNPLTLTLRSWSAMFVLIALTSAGCLVISAYKSCLLYYRGQVPCDFKDRALAPAAITSFGFPFGTLLSPICTSMSAHVRGAGPGFCQKGQWLVRVRSNRWMMRVFPEHGEGRAILPKR